MSDAVLFDIDGPVASVTLNRREKLNPQSEEWTEGLLTRPSIRGPVMPRHRRVVGGPILWRWGA